MPRGDGTGPAGQGQGQGLGGGQGQGQGQGQGRGGGRGRMGGPFAAGPGGKCVCPQCGYSTPHLPGQPCNQKQCPKCAVNLIRG